MGKSTVLTLTRTTGVIIVFSLNRQCSDLVVSFYHSTRNANEKVFFVSLSLTDAGIGRSHLADEAGQRV